MLRRKRRKSCGALAEDTYIYRSASGGMALKEESLRSRIFRVLEKARLSKRHF